MVLNLFKHNSGLKWSWYAFFNIENCMSGTRPPMRSFQSVLIRKTRPKHQSSPQLVVSEEVLHYIRFSAELFSQFIHIWNPIDLNGVPFGFVVTFGDLLSLPLDVSHHCLLIRKSHFVSHELCEPSRLLFPYR